MHPKLGLKASSDPAQLKSRLKYRPQVFEFYTSQKDFSIEGLKRLEEAIQEVQERATKTIILHHPMTYQGEFLELVTPPDLLPEVTYFIDKSTNDLLQLSFDYNLQTLVHGSYELHNPAILAAYPSVDAANDYLFQQLDKWSQIGQDHIMFENSISPLFYFGDPNYDAQLFSKNYRLAFDVSHSFIKMQGSNEKLIASLARLKEHIVHYHLVDSMGLTHDSLPLGQGKINWSAVLDNLNPQASAIYEIDLKDMTNPQEQLDSHTYLSQLAANEQNNF